MAKVVCVLYEDPVDGYPASYPRDAIPILDHYPGRPDPAHPRRHRLHPGRAARLGLGRAGAPPVPRSPTATPWW